MSEQDKGYVPYNTNNSYLDPSFFISDSGDNKFLNLALHVATWSKV